MRQSALKWLACLALAAGFESALAQEPVSIVVQPADRTVELGQRTAFAVEAAGTMPRYQWFQNGSRLFGATNSSYSPPAATVTMNGWTYYVVVSNAFNSVTSVTARLTVVPDETGPVAQYAVVTGPAQLEIQFNERMLLSPATNIANYSLHVLGATNRLTVTNALWSVLNRVRLRGPWNLNPLSNYVVCMRNIADFYTNTIVPNPTCLGVGFPETNQVISFGELWRYNDNATNTPPDAWKTLNYNDDPFTPPFHWAEGYGAFGYTFTSGYVPCSPIRTPLSGGVRTYYFRKPFMLSEVYPADTVMRLRHQVDDGAVFYINGTEIYRTPTMPAGEINYFTWAGHVSTAACVTVALPLNALTSGMNLFAVEVHQATEQQPQLADVLFDAELSLEFRRPPLVPALRMSYGASEVTLTWEGDGWSLEAAESVTGPWSRVSTSNNQHTSPLSAPGGRRFFRLVNP